MKKFNLYVAYRTAFVYYMKLALIFIGSGVLTIIGAAVVEVNCHNTVYSDPMVLFSVDTDDGITITFLDHEYRLKAED